EENIHAQLEKFLMSKGKRTAEDFHKELGRELYDKCVLLRTGKGLKEAIKNIRRIRKEFEEDLIVPGDANEVNSELEKAGRVADYMELAELMCIDALHREESCGAHFRAEHQTESGEAKRNDEHFCYSAAWEWTGNAAEPILNKEPLVFETVQPTLRSYK